MLIEPADATLYTATDFGGAYDFCTYAYPVGGADPQPTPTSGSIFQWCSTQGDKHDLERGNFSDSCGRGRCCR